MIVLNIYPNIISKISHFSKIQFNFTSKRYFRSKNPWSGPLGGVRSWKIGRVLHVVENWGWFMRKMVWCGAQKRMGRAEGNVWEVGVKMNYLRGDWRYVHQIYQHC